ncbi:hypothetical protein PshuTeo2_54310 [Pseudomonas hunanensis]|nr:hypothetical protein [Pseudomonas hunanensis]
MGMQVATAFVVLLTDIMQHGDLIPADTTLEVEKRLADQWKGSKIARAATDEEIAEYQGDAAEAEALLDDVDALAGQKRALELELEKLQGRKTELAGDLQALESDVADLGKQKETLAGEVKALEAAKATAEKPATAAKAK